jgi:hypothetical protein
MTDPFLLDHLTIRVSGVYSGYVFASVKGVLHTGGQASKT